MRLLWIAIVLALFQCNAGQEESSTVDQELIDELFNTSFVSSTFTPVQNKAAADTPDIPIGTDTEVTNDLAETAKKPNPCKVGECVPYYLCLNGTIITNGEGILDVRFGDDEEEPQPEHPCPDYFETCCVLKADDVIVPPEEAKPRVTKPEMCGVRNKAGAIFNVVARDNESQFAEFPWVVAIIYKLRDNDAVVNVYKCGGSLIHPGVVMTAAHCVVDLKEVHDILIRAGEWDTQTEKEPYPHQDRVVTEVVIHEKYMRGSHFNDVALLFLEKPVDLAENVNTACLPPQDSTFDHQRCFAAGWGKDKFGKDGIYQVILKRIELPVVPHDECQLKLRETRLSKYFILDPSFICAGGESGRDTCQGDGGSPLSCEVPNTKHGQYYVTGEVAWGIGCFDAVPGVYVNVAKYRHWIDKVFDDRKLEQKYYIAQS